MVGFSFTLYPLFAKALMASLALILTPVFVLAVTVVLAFFQSVYQLQDTRLLGIR